MLETKLLSTRRRWIDCSLAATVLAVVGTGSVLAASAAGPTNTKEPSITGSPITGKVLTGDRGTWSGTSNTYTYSWLRCDKNAANCVAITGATGTQYTITSADLGATIRFEVTASDNAGQDHRNFQPDR